MSTTDDVRNSNDPYAASSRETTEGTVYTVTGGDWDEFLSEASGDERIVINMGPQHPSTHGVLRLVLELEGETVTDARLVIGYLHTGIEKNCEYRTWTQGVTFVTRCDYLAPLFTETAYCLSTERLLGIEAPPRAQTIRVLLMEINRIGSHLVALATGGMELGALTGMTNGFREREEVLHLLEYLTGLRMNHAFIRPGGVVQDLPEGYEPRIRAFVTVMNERLPGFHKLLTGNRIWQQRLQGVGYLPLDGCLSLGVTGPILRSAGLAWDLRTVEPYLGYEHYDFEVPTATEADSFARYLLRVEEMNQSLKIIEQCLDRLEPGPVMVEDAKIAWPAKLSIGADGMGNSLEHVRKIMGQSMESLIHHFKLVTEGFKVPPGQAYVPVESPRGELGAHLVSDGGTRPLRVHLREPSFVNLQAAPAMSEGGLVSDVIAALASLDPVMGDVTDELVDIQLPGPHQGLAADVAASTPDEHHIDESGGTPAQHQELSAVDLSVFDGVRERAAAIIARYPEPRSALLPLLHLVQYVDGHVSRAGIAFCAETLGITTAEVSAVTTFYTMYKREPVGEHLVSVCTNTLCAALGGDEIYRAVGEQLGEPGAPLGHERTSGEPGETGSITLEHAECLAACDLAPVLTVNYEFFDRQTVASATEIVEALRRGEKPHPTRGAPLTDFRRIELLLAGFFDDPEVGGLDAVAGPSADDASLRGARLAEERGWQAPPLPEKAEPTTNPHAGGAS